MNMQELVFSEAFTFMHPLSTLTTSHWLMVLLYNVALWGSRGRNPGNNYISPQNVIRKTN